MAIKQEKNLWKELHDYLLNVPGERERKNKATERKEEICRLTSWDNTTFYRKLNNPKKLSIADKITISGVYELPARILFPELQTEKA